MSHYESSSAHPSNRGSDSNSSQYTSSTEYNDFDFDSLPELRPFDTSLEKPGPPSLPLGPAIDLGIDPQLLKQSAPPTVGEAGGWAPGFNEPTTYGDSIAGDANDQLQSMDHWPYTEANEPPWSPQQAQQQQLWQSHYGSATSVAQRPAESVDFEQTMGGLTHMGPHPPNFDTPNPQAVLSYASVAARSTTLPDPGNAKAQGKIPIDRLPSAAPKHNTPGQFKCQVCGKAFDREDCCRRHEVSQHGASNTFYRCDLCGFDDRRRDKVLEHCQKMHDQSPGQELCRSYPGSPSRVKRPRGPNKNPRGRRA